MAVPILGRLTWHDYKRLPLAVAILILECCLRFVAWIIPVSALDFLRYRIFRYIIGRSCLGRIMLTPNSPMLP